MAEIKTSHYDIANYWKRKYITRDGSVVDKWVNGCDLVVTDFGEPMCWACGKPIIGHYEKSMRYEAAIDFHKLWNDGKLKSKLDRCHIVPASMGGSDSPCNLFLLCHSCHTLSPDTTNPRSFFRWVYLRRKQYSFGVMNWQTIIAEINKELGRRGIGTLEQVVNLSTPVDSDKMMRYLKDNVGSHWSYYAESSLICATCDYLQKEVVAKCL